MTTFRIAERVHGFTRVDNSVINDKLLTWEARGLLIYLLSKPDNWIVRNTDLINQSPSGREKTRRVVKELEDAGYIKRNKINGEGGKFQYECVVSDKRLTSDGFTVTGLTVNGKPVHLVNTDDQVNTDLNSVPSESKELTPEEISVLNLWSELFPEKAQPKRTPANSRIKKLKTRMKNADFCERWEKSMRHARTLVKMKDGWFQFEFFVRNDDNYQRILDGVWDSWNKESKQETRDIRDRVLAELKKLISTYGSRRFNYAKESASFNLAGLLKHGEDTWSNVCDKKEKDLEVWFYTAWNNAKEARGKDDTETKTN